MKKNTGVILWLSMLSFRMCGCVAPFVGENEKESWIESNNVSALVRIVWWFSWFEAFKIARYIVRTSVCWNFWFFRENKRKAKGFYMAKSGSIERVMLKNWAGLHSYHWRFSPFHCEFFSSFLRRGGECVQFFLHFNTLDCNYLYRANK